MRKIVPAVLFIAAVASAFAAPKTFVFGKGSDAQQLATVESQAPFETFTGRSSKLTGSVQFDPDKRTGSGSFEINVASIDTGIAMRNEHMTDVGWLDAAKHPTIKFVSTNVRHKSGDIYAVTGDFTLKGVTKRITIDVRVRYMPASDQTRAARFRGDVLHVQSTFKVKLADHNIKHASINQGKVGETVTITISAFGQTG
ncbi:MAG: YceI family protein [Armatimonadetes bacterium]|nr:YceI family protein [Armatimonadota bacterium]